MKKHLVSFLRSPVGYLANFAASVAQYLPGPLERALDRFLPDLCERFCARDGVQDDPLF